MGEVGEAIRRYNERKVAAGADDQHETTDPFLRRLWSGLELDLEEVVDAQGQVLVQCKEALGEMGVPDVIEAAWSDGLITGMLLMESRLRPEPDPDVREGDG